jgi:PIN domain nuclease of toxin-antitoxin system
MAKFLLDTSVLILWLAGSDRLAAPIAERINAGGGEVVVSAVAGWEIAAKQAAGKLVCPDDIEEQLAASDFTVLAVTLHHALAAGRLPPHHTDPFDRLMLAQAKCEGLTFITRQPELGAYGVDLLVA